MGILSGHSVECGTRGSVGVDDRITPTVNHRVRDGIGPSHLLPEVLGSREEGVVTPRFGVVTSKERDYMLSICLMERAGEPS